MSKIRLREKAVSLRIQGKTYSQIRKTLKVSKGTLSGWLKDLELSSSQREILEKNKSKAKYLAVEKYRATRHIQKIKRLTTVFDHQTQKLLPLTEKEFFIAGSFLYWGEGEKTHGRISISNSNPQLVKFALHWMVDALDIPKEKIRVMLHLYKDMNLEKIMEFWSSTLDLPKSQFLKPYVKKSNREGLTYKSYGYGTCRLYFGSVGLSEQVAMSIKAISEFYGTKNDTFWYN